MESCKDELILKMPASWSSDRSMDSLPIGNGKTGALIYGAVKSENIIINRYDLWNSGKTPELPDISATLKQVRHLMDMGEFKQANYLASDELKQKGYKASPASPFTLCNLKITLFNKKEFKHYRRVLNMATGEVTVSYEQDQAKFKRRTFISRKNDTLVYEIAANKGKINANISLEMYKGDAENYKKKYNEIKDTLSITYDNEYIFFKAKNDNGKDYGAVLKLFAIDSDLRTENQFLGIENASKIGVLLKTFSNGEYKIEFERLKSDLDSIKFDYANLLSEHVELHNTLYTSASIELSTKDCLHSNEELLLDAYEEHASAELIEKLWNYGRYLLISGTCEDGLPFPLHGLWHAGYNLVWSQHVANINIQMIYWHTQVGGLNSSLKSVIDYFYNKIDEFRENAKKIFGCSGIYVPVYTEPTTGKLSDIAPVIVNYISCGGWISSHFYQYYLYSDDKQTLIQKILPFMLEVAKFYEDYIVWDENGKIKIYPSVSPENSPKNFIPSDFNEHMGHPAPSVMNATMDFAIIKEFFTNLIQICSDNNRNLERIDNWKNILSGIPDYMKNPEGDIKEWMHKDLNDHYNHRHISHLYPVFPGYEITGEKNHDLLDAFKMSVDKRELGGQSGWSLTFMSNLYARFGDGEKALNCLDILTRSCLTNSFMTLHNDYRDMGLTLEYDAFQTKQLDANMGLVNAIQEMLFYTSKDLIKLLPACPKRFSQGKVHSFRFPSGSISFEWDFEAKYFKSEIHAEELTRICLMMPAIADYYKILQNDKTLTIQKSSYIDIEILKGDVLYIMPTE